MWAGRCEFVEVSRRFRTGYPFDDVDSFTE
jgi:hypothetical protein